MVAWQAWRMSWRKKEEGSVQLHPMASGLIDMSLLRWCCCRNTKRIARLSRGVQSICQPRCNGGDEGLRGDGRDKMKQAAGGSEGGNSLVGWSVRRMKSSRRPNGFSPNSKANALRVPGPQCLRKAGSCTRANGPESLYRAKLFVPDCA